MDVINWSIDTDFVPEDFSCDVDGNIRFLFMMVELALL